MKPSLRRLVVPALAVAILLALALSGVPVLNALAWVALSAVATILLIWLAVRAYQAFLWKVGRRLAFSYFLIGILPIPMVAALGLAICYLFSSFFLAHVYRNRVELVQNDLAARAQEQLALFAFDHPVEEQPEAYAFDYFRDGEWIAGAGLTGKQWPAWLAEPPEGSGPEGDARYVVGVDGYPTLALAVEEGKWGVTAVYTGALAELLRARSGMWVELGREEDEETPGVVMIRDREFRDSTSEGADPTAERQEFFAAQAQSTGLWDQPRIFSWQISGPVFALVDGSEVAPEVEAILTSTPRGVMKHLFANRPEQDIAAWFALFTVGGFLLSIYGLAVLLALAMIFGLSRAVNHLSKATEAVRQGDFSTRIPVYRQDQLGELQRSFNQMTADLEGLVATAAQKEILEKELEIARQLQESLLPTNLPQGDSIDFATLFEPSAAIGGDYFDILRVDETHVAVMIADVSGHGLSSGLRMAMMKAALQILVDSDAHPNPGAIFGRLDEMVRANAQNRFFVTATLGLLDLKSGILEMTSAGHPPTYLLRGGEASELIIPGSPLGTLGNTYESREVQLEPSDILVWMSDGLIEATNHRDEAFGYDRVLEALSGEASSPAEVRGRLLAAVEAHAAGREPDDDRTLVVMRFQKRS